MTRKQLVKTQPVHSNVRVLTALLATASPVPTSTSASTIRATTTHPVPTLLVHILVLVIPATVEVALSAPMLMSVFCSLAAETLSAQTQTVVSHAPVMTDTLAMAYHAKTSMNAKMEARNVLLLLIA